MSLTSWVTNSEQRVEADQGGMEYEILVTYCSSSSGTFEDIPRLGSQVLVIVWQFENKMCQVELSQSIIASMVPKFPGRSSYR